LNGSRKSPASRSRNPGGSACRKRLGFHDEGLCNDYLFIDGLWRVHRLVALLNRSFVLPDAWRNER